MAEQTVLRFLGAEHASYLATYLDDDKDTFNYLSTVHLRIGGAYWSLAALSVLRKIDSQGRFVEEDSSKFPSPKTVVQWVLACQNADGGFGSNIGQDSHLTCTHYALLVLCLLDALHELSFDNRARAVYYSLARLNSDGSVSGDVWGEADMRFSFQLLAVLTILLNFEEQCGASRRPSATAAKGEEGTNPYPVPKPVLRETADRVAAYVAGCQNHDGGLGTRAGLESHAAYTFCGMQALALADSLHLIDQDAVANFLCKRQTACGGFNGRPEKAPDACYAWWITACLALLDRMHVIGADELGGWLLQCQNAPSCSAVSQTSDAAVEDRAEEDRGGGIADRPGNMPDPFHTFFGVAGLSLLVQEFPELGPDLDLAPVEINGEVVSRLKCVDPVHALPLDVVRKLGLPRFVCRKEQVSS